MKTTTWLAGLMLASAMTVSAATNDMATVLQRGLFEEEANRNLDAAIQAYQSVANQFDKDRRLAATAIFRLGECYRKQGDTNAATAQYDRIVREFPDQSALTTLSRQSLAALGGAAGAPAVPVLSDAARQEQEQLLEEEIKLVQKQLDQQQQQVTQGLLPSGELLPTQRDLLKLKRQMAALEAGQPVDLADASSLKNKASELTTSEAEEVKRIQALIKDSPDLINASGPNGTTPLHLAAEAGQLVVAQFLLANGADTEAKDTQWGGRTPLHYAAAAGHKAMVELLLSKKANVNAADKDGTTPLHLAAESGYRSVVESLLNHGAKVNAKDKYGSTPLLLAATRGFRSVIELLLEHGADINAATTYAYRSRGGGLKGTALDIAAQRSDQTLAEFLLSKGAAVNTVNDDGRTPLSYAVENRQEPFVKLLLDAHADPNAGSADFPIARAAWLGDLDTLKLLLAKGADPNTNGKVSWDLRYDRGTPPPIMRGATTATPLYLAVHQHHPEAVKELIAAKADPNGLGPERNPVIFDALYDAPTLKALLEGGADPNRRDASGETTPLQATLSLGERQSRTTAGELLLAHGADPNVAAKNGWTPLHQATWNGDEGLVGLLLKKGAQVNPKTTDSVRTPLQNAAASRHTDVARLLLENKADPNARDFSGETALGIAVECDEPDMVKLLLENKADPNARDNAGATPLDYAKGRPPHTARPLPAIAALLRQYGALDDAPRLDAIEVRRPSTGYSVTFFHKGADEGNQFTLAEALGIEYAFLAETSWGDPDWRSDYQLLAANHFDKSLPYPDLAHVRIREPAPDSKSWQERTVDLSPLLETGACSNDVTLNWGEVVEIPEQDHPLNQSWSGFTPRQMENLKTCLTRQVEIVIKGQATKITLGPEVSASRRPVRYGSAPEKDVTKGTLWLKPALLNSKLVLASSDLSRVKVTRLDPVTGQKREWVVDCSDGKPAPDLWLRDGDVIEVPERAN
jgi:ankyrin repeat protein